MAQQKPEVDPHDGPAPADLLVTDLVVGDGAEARAGQNVEVHYVGVAHSSGEEFDASWNRGSTFRFPLGAGRVIGGWDQGVVGMKVGGRRRLVIPPHLGYGDRGAGGAIKGGETLIFVVDLLGTSWKLLIVSDTHIPARARDLPAPVWAAVDAADVVIHAGDWITEAALDVLESRAARLIGVFGNNDGAELRARLPEIAHVELSGVRFAVVHETGSSKGREKRCSAAYPDTDVLVFGHSHIPWDSTTVTGLRLLNPGSPTDRRRQATHTWMTASVNDGTLGEVTLHHL